MGKMKCTDRSKQAGIIIVDGIILGEPVEDEDGNLHWDHPSLPDGEVTKTGKVRVRQSLEVEDTKDEEAEAVFVDLPAEKVEKLSVAFDDKPYREEKERLENERVAQELAASEERGVLDDERLDDIVDRPRRNQPK